jgi:hypothetical protein
LATFAAVPIVSQFLSTGTKHCPAAIAPQQFLLPGDVDSEVWKGALGQDGTVRPFDFVVDAIDSVHPKRLLLEAVLRLGVRVVSAMGAGG